MNYGVMISILEVPGLELHSSGTEPVTFFGAQSSLEWGAQFSFGGHKQWLGGHGHGMPPWRRASRSGFCGTGWIFVSS